MANFLDGLLSGKNAFTQTTASFAQPAVGANVTVPVVYSGWTAVGMAVFLEAGGNYQVVSIPNDGSIQIKNLGSSGNAAVSASIPPGRMAPAGAPGANGTSGTGAPAPDYVATSNIALTGSVTVDGATPATGKLVLATAQTNAADRLYWVANTAGAWTLATFNDTDAKVAALAGILSGATLNGAGNKGSQWYLQSGTTLAGTKVWSRPINGIYFAPLPTGNVALDTPPLKALASICRANPGTTVQLAFTPGTDYHIDDELDFTFVRGCTFRGGGGSFSAGSRIVSEVVSKRTMITASFVQPASNLALAGARTVVGSVLVNVSSTAGFRLGHVVEADAVGTPSYYTVIALTSSTQIELKPTSYNQVSAGTTIPAYGRLRSNDAIIAGRSCNTLKLEGVSLVSWDPLFVGSGFLCDGRIYANDVTLNRLTHSFAQTQNFAFVLPPLYGFGASSIPTTTLTGFGSACLRLRVEFTGTGTYRYTTQWREDGAPVYWNESGLLVSAGAHALQGLATGLTFTPSNTAYTVGTMFEASIGMTAMTVLAGFNNMLEHCEAAYTFDVFNAIGVGNYVNDLICTYGIAGQSVVLSGAGGECNAVSEPGAENGSGGVLLWNCFGVSAKMVSGDQSDAGPWVQVSGGGGIYVDTTCSINTATVGAPGAVIRCLGCTSITVKGNYQFAPKVIDFGTGAVTLHCKIENIGTAAPTGLAALYTGTAINQLDWAGYGSNVINSPILNGIVSVTNGFAFSEVAQGALTGTVNNIVINNALTYYSLSASTIITGLSGSNLVAGYDLLFCWTSYDGGPLTFAHQNAGSLAANRITTRGGQDVTIASAGNGLGWAHLRKSAFFNGWILLAHSGQADASNAPITLTLVNGVNSNLDDDGTGLYMSRTDYEITGPSAAFSTSGFVAGFNGQRMRIRNRSGQVWTITNNATSTAANRILTQTGADVTPVQWADFEYSTADARWILFGRG